MNKNLKRYLLRGYLWPKVMKLTAILTLALCVNLSAASISQTLKDLNYEKVELKKLIREIEKQTDYKFFYNLNDVRTIKDLTVKEEAISVEDLLNQQLKKTPLTFEIIDETIVLKHKVNQSANSTLRSNQNSFRTVKREIEEITGIVTDEGGVPLPGVIVQLKGTNQAVITNEEGSYRLLVPDTDVVLVYRFVGYESQEILVGNQNKINVKLKISVTGLDEFVVTGVVERDKESFTGAATSFSGTELKQITNGNAVQALKTLDPSVIIFENNQFGSNPNVLPNIEVRGKTSISTTQLRDEFGSDPNQPLFILDGFETTLQTIVDLDINRIKSITILKDAASTALYGSVAANGVIVVETKRPEVGKIMLSYSGDFRVDAPDLSDYNMMNAEEKLEFERLSGRYEYWSIDPEFQLPLDAMYNQRLAEVRRGVDTYWLSEPVQTGFTNSHTLYADGGSNELRFGVSANYRNVQGVMKGSGRETWQGSVDINYRKGKINISNKLFVNGYTSTESPYGSFANFVNANPYFRKYNEDGGIDMYFERGIVSGLSEYKVGEGVPNPLYNALLDNQYDETRNLSVQNNLQLRYNISPSFRIQAATQILGAKKESEAFINPLNTQFDGVNYLKRGRYNNSQSSNFLYRGNVMAVYSKVIGKHSFTGNVRGEIQNEQNERKGYVATGFPVGAVGNPAFAFSYQENSNPSAAYKDFRRVNVLASVNYAYNQRFLLDATYRLDGSTAFGRNNPYSPFWAVGGGWNLHNEPSLKNSSVLNNLRLRGNVGVTGNQSFGNITSISVYNYFQNLNIFGQGVSLATLGNPDLEWQRTKSYSVGIDFGFLKNRVSGFVNGYRKITDPLIVVLDQPSSTGIVGVPMNVGLLDTRGIETNIKYSPIFKPQQGVVLTLGWMGSFIVDQYDEFDNMLNKLNEEEEESNSLYRYKDGYSPTDIWAVQSLGIDPATGQEIFLKNNGERSFEYDPRDIVRVGNTRPFSEGVLSTNLSYKGWLLNVYMRYKVGGEVFNSALFNKVENIDYIGITFNQDRRALTERWKEPGDISQFKGISITEKTQMSSRFVQEENSLTGESISLGYQWNANSHFLKNMGLSRLRVNAIMNDIFRMSSVKVERGIQYPFARTVSLSLNATF